MPEDKPPSPDELFPAKLAGRPPRDYRITSEDLIERQAQEIRRSRLVIDSALVNLDPNDPISVEKLQDRHRQQVIREEELFKTEILRMIEDRDYKGAREVMRLHNALRSANDAISTVLNMPNRIVGQIMDAHTTRVSGGVGVTHHIHEPARNGTSRNGTPRDGTPRTPRDWESLAVAITAPPALPQATPSSNGVENTLEDANE